jgi:hypothetical protein
MSDIEPAGRGDIERPRGPSAVTLVVYGLAAVGAFALFRFVFGTVFSVLRLGLLVGVVLLVIIGIRAFMSGPPDS